MTRRALAGLCVAVLCAAPASAALPFSDDFESGVSGSVWTKWPGDFQEILQTDSSHNITLGGSKAARAHAADPTGYNAYADFGSTPGFVRAKVYVFEDLSNPGSASQPITNMLALVGDNNTATPNFSTDYLQLGVVSFLPAGNGGYSTRSRANGADISTNTGVARAAGWTKLAIEADALADGGGVRYYINDALVGSSVRSTGVNLRWIRLGNNSKSYENFWYDNVSVVPEPASVLLFGMGGVALVGYATRRRRSR